MDIVPLKMFPSFCVALFLGLAFRAYAKVFTGYVVGITDGDTITVLDADYRRRFEETEIREQAEQVGLWSEKSQIPPEKWRRGLRTAGQPCDNCPRPCHSIQSHHVLMGALVGIKQKRPEMAVFL